MVEERKITLVLKTEEDEGGSKFSKKLERQLKPGSKKQKKSPGKVLTNRAINSTLNLVKSAASLTKNRYFNMSENYLLENQINQITTVANSAKNGISAIITGAKVGSIGGPIGTAIGAGIGALTFVTTEAIAYQGKLSNYYSSLNATNMQTQWGAKRAGLWDNGRGTEN